MRRQMLALHESMRKLNRKFPGRWTLHCKGGLVSGKARVAVNKGPCAGMAYFNAATERAALDQACKELGI